MIEAGKHPFLYNFLTSPKYKIWKHILLVVILIIISSNQVFRNYEDVADVLKSNIYWICLSAIVLYLIVAYVNIYVLVPNFLLNRKYGLYIIALSTLIALLIATQSFQEFFTRTSFGFSHRVDSYVNPLILVNNSSAFMIMLICFSGTSINALLRHWMIESKRVNQLEREHIQSEVDQLKDQITPDFLSNILNHTSVLVKKEPAKASDMLMRLGQLLRYQLYDCSRDKVLLSSEVSFLKNYLDLEKLYNNKFEYNISTEGDINRVLISPLLFIPFIQDTVSKINNLDEAILLHLHLKADDKSLLFTSKIDNTGISLDSEFLSIRQRLNLLYDNSYSLIVTKTMIQLQLTLPKS